MVFLYILYLPFAIYPLKSFQSAYPLLMAFCTCLKTFSLHSTLRIPNKVQRFYSGPAVDNSQVHISVRLQDFLLIHICYYFPIGFEYRLPSVLNWDEVSRAIGCHSLPAGRVLWIVRALAGYTSHIYTHWTDCYV